MATSHADKRIVQSNELHAALFKKVRLLLAAGKNGEARQAITHRDLEDPALKNALAVCLLRLGEVAEASRLLRSMVLNTSSLALVAEMPTTIKANFATAMLLSGQVQGAVEILDEIGDDTHPAVARLRAAVAEWRKGLNLWQRLTWLTGTDVNRPISLGTTPGELWPEES